MRGLCLSPPDSFVHFHSSWLGNLYLSGHSHSNLPQSLSWIPDNPDAVYFDIFRCRIVKLQVKTGNNSRNGHIDLCVSQTG